MGVYIGGMEMPKEGSWKTVRIYPDGTCAVPNWQGDCTLIKGAKAVQVPPHGRLIDADALTKDLVNRWYVNDDQDFCNKEAWLGIEDAPIIIPAEEGE